MPISYPPGTSGGGGMSNPMTTPGDVIYGGVAGAPARLAAGTATQLFHGGATPSWTALATADIAANAVSQAGYAAGATSGPTTTSGSYVDLTDMSVTLTTTGGDLLVWFSSAVTHTTGGQYIFLGLQLDAGGMVADRNIQAPAAGYAAVISTFHRFTGVSAGSHTVKGRWLTQSATATANTTQRGLLVLELKR
jgi:hypothetical protein